VRTKSFAGMNCPIAGALEAIGDRWAFLILRDLSIWPARFDDFKESTGIPNTTLSDRLRHLETHGLIERHPYQDNPTRFEYALTRKGRDLWMVNLALAQWGERWDASGAGAPAVRIVDRETGRKLKLALVDATTGEPVPPARMRPRPGPAASAFMRRRLKLRDAGDARS
jgi:DNA-binding HxlR family transcriptional regulator